MQTSLPPQIFWGPATERAWGILRTTKRGTECVPITSHHCWTNKLSWSIRIQRKAICCLEIQSIKGQSASAGMPGIFSMHIRSHPSKTGNNSQTYERSGESNSISSPQTSHNYKQRHNRCCQAAHRVISLRGESLLQSEHSETISGPVTISSQNAQPVCGKYGGERSSVCETVEI